MVRGAFIDENGVKRGAWSKEEDDKLKAYILKYGYWNWREIPKFAGLSRCGKSCRLRWMNYLRPGVKHGNYSKEEDDMIIQLHQKFGNKWSKIAEKLQGRTDNEIKNYWHAYLKKRSSTSGCESSSGSDSKSGSVFGSEEKQYSSTNQTMTENGNTDCYLILESSQFSSTEDDQNEMNIPQFTTTNTFECDETSNSNMFETFENCSGDFWSQPFVVDDQDNHYIVSSPHHEPIMSSYFTNYDEYASDLFYQVSKELPGIQFM